MINTTDSVFQISKITDLAETKIKTIKEFLIDVYSDVPSYNNSVYTNPNLDTCILMYEENELIGHAGITKRSVNIKNKVYKVAGIGDIAIKPKLQGKGLGNILMKKTNEVIKAEGYDVGLLFCHPKLSNFYSGCRWVKKEKGKVFALQHGQLEDQRLSYLLPLKLDLECLGIWNNEDINVGKGSW